MKSPKFAYTELIYINAGLNILGEKKRIKELAKVSNNENFSINIHKIKIYFSVAVWWNQ